MTDLNQICIENSHTIIDFVLSYIKANPGDINLPNDVVIEKISGIKYKSTPKSRSKTKSVVKTDQVVDGDNKITFPSLIIAEHPAQYIQKSIFDDCLNPDKNKICDYVFTRGAHVDQYCGAFPVNDNKKCTKCSQRKGSIKKKVESTGTIKEENLVHGVSSLINLPKSNIENIEMKSKIEMNTTNVDNVFFGIKPPYSKIVFEDSGEDNIQAIGILDLSQNYSYGVVVDFPEEWRKILQPVPEDKIFILKEYGVEIRTQSTQKSNLIQEMKSINDIAIIPGLPNHSNSTDNVSFNLDAIIPKKH